MEDNESWESKRGEVWKRIVELEGAVKDLTSAISGVKTLAESKVSADEKTANDAALKALSGLEKVNAAVLTVEGLAESINQLQTSLPKALSEASRLSTDCKQGNDDRQSIAELLGQCQQNAKSLSDILKSAKTTADEIAAKMPVVEQQCQIIANQKAQATSHTAEIQNICSQTVSLKTEIDTYSQTFKGTIGDAKNDLQSLQDEKRSELDALITEKTNALDSLYSTSEQSLRELAETRGKQLDEQYTAHEESHSSQMSKQKSEFESQANAMEKTYLELKARIESLLPGATSAGLASAFKERKDKIERTKKGWIIGALLSSVALVSLGVCSLFGWMPSQGLVLSVAGRSVIIVGLIFIEEFCRRNYNVATRLSEAYAYKEVLATSYLGYKEQMEEIPMPRKGDQEPDKGHSVLMQTLLEKLREDPGKDVFDKERQIVGLPGFLDAATKGDKDDDSAKETQGSLNAQFGAGKLATKVTWPVVVFSGIVLTAVCIILGMLLKTGCIITDNVMQPVIEQKGSSVK